MGRFRKTIKEQDRRFKSALTKKYMQYCMATIVRKRIERLFADPGHIRLDLPEMNDDITKRYAELVLNEAASMCYVKEDRILKAMYAGIGNITLSEHSDSESE